MKKILKVFINLKSDLCVGSGYSYAGIIDSDVCYDKYGIPYIPARRLKGCLRDSAKLINCSHINEIFGRTGDDRSGSLQIANAYLSYRDDLIEQIEAIKHNEGEEYVNAQAVLQQLTNIKAQTAIEKESGKAKDDSLRFIRVVNQHDADKNENVFIAEAAVDEEYLEETKRIFKALRHIGLNRNRGLGSVVCRVEEESRKSNNKHIKIDLELSDDNYYRIDYVMTNIQPLMLSNENASETQTYIPGQSVLGFFASKHPEINQEFEDLFLNGKTIYSNIYPVVKGKRSLPVPDFLNKLKKTKQLVNVLVKEEHEVGNQPKKLNGYYYIDTGDGISLCQPELDVVYHHTKRSDANPDGLLYSLVKLDEGQRYQGYIVVQGKYVNKLVNVLENNDLYFGKSKSAQYGKCVIESGEVNEYKKASTHYNNGDIIVVTMASDGIFIKDNQYYTNNVFEVKDIIAEQLNIDYDKEYHACDFVSTKYITGYNTKWNLKKPSFSAIKAGSSLIYKLNKDTDIAENYVGEKNLEGYGEIHILKLSDMKQDLKENDSESNVEIRLPERVRTEVSDMILDSLYTSLLDEAISNGKKLNISSSLLGRLVLMVRQSNDKKDLMKRIKSIESDNEREDILKYVKSAMFEKDDEESVDVSKYNEYILLTKLNKDNDYIFDMNRWKNYLLTLLSQEKYLNKKKEVNKDE